MFIILNILTPPIHHIMSWYLFKDAPTFKPRGIKVDGFQQSLLHRPKINLSWGMNQKPYTDPLPNIQKDIIPATVNANDTKNSNEAMSHVKVLTETSEDEEEELMKLIKKRSINNRQLQLINSSSKTKVRSQSLHNNAQYQFIHQNQDNSHRNEDFTKKVRYLENSLLPNCKRDSMATILDYSLSKEVPLSDSRMSCRSNKKNESNVVLGDGFNAFIPPNEIKKDLTRKLQEIYEYDQQRRRRLQNSGFALG